jgi:hypothetical protein
MCQLRTRFGYGIDRQKITPKLWRYTLVSEPPAAGGIPIPKTDFPPLKPKVCAPIYRRETEKRTTSFDERGQGLLLVDV